MKNTINTAEWPMNFTDHLFGFCEDSDRRLPDDYSGSLEYVLITMLTEVEQKAIRLRYQEGLTYREMSEVLGVERGKVEPILRKAFRKLRHPTRSRYLLYGVSGYLNRFCQRCEETTYNEGYQKGYQEGFAKGQEECGASTQAQQNPPVEECGTIQESDLIDCLDLSVRTYNGLKMANINTIGELITKTRSEIFQLRNIGVRSLNDLERRLKVFHLSLHEESATV